MDMTRSDTIRLIKTGLSTVCAIILVMYATWRSLDYARGPDIIIDEPRDGEIVLTSTITVHGRAERIKNISINGNPLSMNGQGDWSEELLVFPGLNIITVSAEDKFGRKISTNIRLVGQI